MNDQQDLEYIRLLSIFHYVVGGMLALCSLFPCIYLALGVAFIAGGMDGQQGGDAPPEAIGWIFVVFGLTLMAIALSLAACIAMAGVRLASRTSYTFCLVVACIECLFMPLGTILGVFTLVVLMRPGVRERFETSHLA